MWKYELRLTGVTDVEMPEGAIVLSAGCQFESLVVWALVDPLRAKVRRRLAAVMTGADAPPLTEAGFVGTVQLQGGAFVVHVFEQVQA